ncbi:hypothetical protein ES708_06305 [subsurface metagenome]
MEETAFKKDETPYLVFTCKKCRQYSYVKTTQKTKKCLRCGRTHQVKDILGLGEIVYGMTAAVNTVKQKQTELATPEFRSEGDFVVATNQFPSRTPVKKSKSKVLSDKNNDKNIDNEFKEQFSEVLLELSRLYGKFPRYMLEIMADNYGIPAVELKMLIKSFKKQGIITVLKNEDFYYQLELKLLSDLQAKN